MIDKHDAKNKKNRFNHWLISQKSPPKTIIGEELNSSAYKPIFQNNLQDIRKQVIHKNVIEATSFFFINCPSFNYLKSHVILLLEFLLS